MNLFDTADRQALLVLASVAALVTAGLLGLGLVLGLTVRLFGLVSGLFG